MPFNVGTIRDLVELYAGQGGVNRERIPPKLVHRVINFKLQEFSRRTGALSSKITRKTVADQQEYELGPDVVHITKVNFDGSEAHKILFKDVDRIADNVS